MQTVLNRAPERAEVHFPAGHPYSCGASLGQRTSRDADKVTCHLCLGEAHSAAFAAERVR